MKTYEVRVSMVIEVEAESSEDAQIQAADMVYVSDVDGIDLDTEAIEICEEEL